MPPKAKKKSIDFVGDLKVIGDIAIGDTKLRLVATEKGRQYIQLWSSLSKQWKVMYRYKVEENWNLWKKLADAKLHTKKSGRPKSRSDNELVGTTKSPKRKPRAKASPKQPKDSKLSRNKSGKVK